MIGDAVALLRLVENNRRTLLLYQSSLNQAIVERPSTNTLPALMSIYIAAVPSWSLRKATIALNHRRP